MLQQVLGIEIIKPTKGEKYQILLSAIDNALIYLKSNYLLYQQQKQQKMLALSELAKILKMEKLETIVAFDISNLFSCNKVAGLVYFQNGQCVNNKCRHYIINQLSLSSDYACMEFVINKYLQHHFHELPNLIIVDGNQIQINAAIKAFEKQKIAPPVIIGLVKDDQHKTTAIAYKRKIIPLVKNSSLYLFLFSLQKKVHETVINFYRKKHDNSLFNTSLLPKITGLSLTKKNLLLEKYKSTDNIKKVPIGELAQIIDINVAKKLKKALKA